MTLPDRFWTVCVFQDEGLIAEGSLAPGSLAMVGEEFTISANGGCFEVVLTCISSEDYGRKLTWTAIDKGTYVNQGRRVPVIEESE